MDGNEDDKKVTLPAFRDCQDFRIHPRQRRFQPGNLHLFSRQRFAPDITKPSSSFCLHPTVERLRRYPQRKRRHRPLLADTHQSYSLLFDLKRMSRPHNGFPPAYPCGALIRSAREDVRQGQGRPPDAGLLGRRIETANGPSAASGNTPTGGMIESRD